MTNKLVNESEVKIKVEMDNLVEDIKDLNRSIEEAQAIYEAKALQLLENFQDRNLILNTRKEHLEEKLRILFEQVETKETKTQRKVELLSGDVVVKKSNKKITCDKEKLLEWANQNGRHDLIQTKITTDFMWSEFKPNLAIQEGLEADGIIDTTTGEMLNIDGISVEIEEEKMVIK